MQPPHRPADPASVRAPPRSGHAACGRPANTAPTPDAGAPRSRCRPTSLSRRQHPAVRPPMPVVAPPRQPDRPLPGRRPRCERAVGAVRPPEDRCQPVRASHPAITVMSASTAAGVARAPIPAYRNVAMFDLPGCDSAAPSPSTASLPEDFSLPPRCRISPAAQNGSGQALPVRAFLCEIAGRERARIHNEGEKAGAQERDRGQVRPDEGKRESRDLVLRRALHGGEGPREASQDRHVSRHVQATRHRPERPLGSSDHGNAIQLPHRPSQGTHGRVFGDLPGLRRGVHRRRFVPRGHRASRRLSRGSARGPDGAARGHSHAEPGEGPAGGGSRR